MLRVAWRLARGYRLRPWRSPYLRWRIETYSGIHAQNIGFSTFWKFVWRRRTDLARYLKWAEEQACSGRARPVIRGRVNPPTT